MKPLRSHDHPALCLLVPRFGPQPAIKHLVNLADPHGEFLSEGPGTRAGKVLETTPRTLGGSAG